MKLLRVGLVAVAFCMLFSVSAHAVDTVPYYPPPEFDDSPLLVTGYSLAGARLGYTQLFNSSDQPVHLDGWRMEYATVQSGAVVSVPLTGWIAPLNYVVVADENVVGNADFLYSPPLLSTEIPLEVRLIPPANAKINEYKVGGLKNGAYQRDKSTSTGKYLTGFIVAKDQLYGGGFYDFPADTPLQFSEIVAHPRSCSPLEAAVECGDYVKLYNPTNQPIELSDFRLRVGYQGQNPSASNTFSLSGVVQAGRYAVISRSADNRPVSLTSSGSFVWLEDTYGVKRYDTTVLEYDDASSDSKKGHAWAYDERDGMWKWTSQSTPVDAPSIFPVEAPEVKASAVSGLVPCKEGQYRSEETNRCRSIASDISALTPCKEGQERSPETNRCRNTASLASSLTPCKENQERNPDTNRCRNVTAGVPAAAFSVEPVTETGTAFVGWWALGGVGALAVGYGAWEWRHELLGALRKVGTFFTSGK